MSNDLATIAHKIREVPDETCQGCPQNWEGECRAYEIPHSRQEREYREQDGGKTNCFPNRRIKS